MDAKLRVFFESDAITLEMLYSTLHRLHSSYYEPSIFCPVPR
jgi:hypothetical protein